MMLGRNARRAVAQDVVMSALRSKYRRDSLVWNNDVIGRLGSIVSGVCRTIDRGSARLPV
jgi:hypothetical protein